MTDELFDALDVHAFAALHDSIRHFGVVYPIAVDQHGTIIDGHNRKRITDELGLPCPSLTYVVDDEAQRLKLAADLNTARRHLTIAERRRMVVKLRSLQHSTRAIAEALHVPPTTVHRDLEAAEIAPVPRGTPDANVVGIDGKTYPAKTKTKPPRNVARDKRAEQIATLAAEGASSVQIGVELGLRDATVRKLARELSIAIPGDLVNSGRARRIDSTRVVRSTVEQASTFGVLLDQVEYSELPRDEIDAWVVTLSEAIRTLTQLRKHLKEAQI